MRTLHYQLCAIIDLSFSKVYKKILQWTACRCSQWCYYTPDRIGFEDISFWQQTSYAEKRSFLIHQVRHVIMMEKS